MITSNFLAHQRSNILGSYGNFEHENPLLPKRALKDSDLRFLLVTFAKKRPTMIYNIRSLNLLQINKLHARNGFSKTNFFTEIELNWHRPPFAISNSLRNSWFLLIVDVNVTSWIILQVVVHGRSVSKLSWFLKLNILYYCTTRLTKRHSIID